MSEEALFDLYLMSLLVYFQGVEEFYRQRILIEPAAFDEQIFIKKAREMSREKLQEAIHDNLEPKIIEIW